MKRLPIGILGSGKGSNCRAIFERIRSGELAAEPRLVVSDVLDAPILDMAREFGVANAYLPPGRFRTRLEPETEEQLVQMLRDAGVELVVLAGFMRVLHEPMLKAFALRIINIHPALLPAFGGRGMYGRRVHEAVLASGARESGASVHLVDEVYDRGEVLARARVPVLPDDDPDRLAARVLEVEHRLLPAVVLAAARAGRPVPIPEPVESHP